jgi:transglutaminase-like putative cysteine protease
MRKWLNSGKLYQMTVTLVFVTAGSGIVMHFFLQEGNIVPILIGTLFPLTITAAHLFLKSRGRGILYTALFLALCTTIYLWSWRSMLTLTGDFLSWIGAGLPILPSENQFQLYQTGFITALNLALCGISLLVAHSRRLRYGLAFAAAIFLLTCMIIRQPLSQIPCVLLLSYICFCYVEFHQGKKWGDHAIGKKTVVWLTPFLAAFLLFLLLMPADQKPYDWKFVQTIWNKIDQGRIWISQQWGRNGKDDFQMAFSGFDADGKVGGDKTDTNQIQMQITNESSAVGGIYLRGAVYNTFEGNGWTYTAQEDSRETWLDAMESVYAALCYEPQQVTDLFLPGSVYMTYEEMKTQYVFTPSKTYRLITDGKMEPLVQKAGFVFPKRTGFGTSYKADYYRMNLGNPTFWEFVDNANRSFYYNTTSNEKISAQMEKYFPNAPFPLTPELLREHSSRVRQDYLPDTTLSPQVETYLKTLLEGADTPTEKLKRIETQLRTYTYTQTPGKLPKGENFLDYFLLSKQEGYCTYFATAFVLLARASGIPARYVQGFCIPRLPTRGESTPVTASMAHAWPEAYLEGVGWLPFEPTPGFASVRYVSWNTQAQMSAYVTAAQETAPQPSPPPEKTDATQPNQEIPTQTTTVEIPIAVILVFLGTLLVAAFLILTFDQLLRLRRYNRLDTFGKISTQVNKTLTLLTALGYPMTPSDTITEQCKRIKTAGLPQETIVFLGTYEQIRYGTQKADTTLLTQAQKQYIQLLETLKHQNPRKYYRYRLFPN